MSTKSPLTNPRMANLPAQGVATRFAVLGLLAAALSGCTVGPDFQRPAAPPVDRYTATPTTATTATTATQHGVAQQLVKGLPIEAQWWRTLGSPALDRLIDEAFNHSPTLAAARATLRQAQELQAAQAGATQYPQVDLGVGAQRQRTSPSSQGVSGDAREFSLYSASVGVRYNLDLTGGS